MLRLSSRSAYRHHPAQPDSGCPSDTPQPSSLSHGKHSYCLSFAGKCGTSPYSTAHFCPSSLQSGSAWQSPYRIAPADCKYPTGRIEDPACQWNVQTYLPATAPPSPFHPAAGRGSPTLDCTSNYPDHFPPPSPTPPVPEALVSGTDNIAPAHTEPTKHSDWLSGSAAASRKPRHNLFVSSGGMLPEKNNRTCAAAPEWVRPQALPIMPLPAYGTSRRKQARSLPPIKIVLFSCSWICSLSM